MPDKVIRKMVLGFISIHILHHASLEPFYGSWMISELNRHGYDMSAGTLYPVLHALEADGLLTRKQRLIEGKIRKYYAITDHGQSVLAEAHKQAYALFREIRDKPETGDL